MPALRSLHDHVVNTLATYEKTKYDSVGIAQLYAELEVVKQFVRGRTALRDMSDRINTALEIGSPSSYEHSYTNHPAQTSVPKQFRRIETPLCKIRTKMTYSNDEKELQGASDTKLLDNVQARLVKFQRDYWEGLEHDFLSAPTSSDQFPDQLRGIPYWITFLSTLTTNGFNLNGGDDPDGFSAGAGGVTKAQEPRWAPAVARFDKVSQDDYFDKIDQFLNLVRMQAVVPHPSIAPEVPSRVIYVQEPVKRVAGRLLTASNESVGMDLGVYKDANVYRSMPVTIWHALSDASSPVQGLGTGEAVSLLIDWNAFMYQVHSAYNRKRTGPNELPEIPGQYVMFEETWHGLHCVRRDRCLRLQSTNAEYIPS
jgi:hypothetical protein